MVPALNPHGSTESPMHIRQYALFENSATACFYPGVNAPLGEWRRLHQTVMPISLSSVGTRTTFWLRYLHDIHPRV
jgi:hypothetical protein